MRGEKHLHFLSGVYRRIVPDQDNRARHVIQHVSQEINDLFPRHTVGVQFDLQFDPARFRCYQQRADQVCTLMMLKTCPQARRLTARGPSPFERTHQRFATFIEKNKGRTQRLPLFLSTASDSVSNTQWRRHRVEVPNVAAFGNSS